MFDIKSLMYPKKETLGGKQVLVLDSWRLSNCQVYLCLDFKHVENLNLNWGKCSEILPIGLIFKADEIKAGNP